MKVDKLLQLLDEENYICFSYNDYYCFCDYVKDEYTEDDYYDAMFIIPHSVYIVTNSELIELKPLSSIKTLRALLCVLDFSYELNDSVVDDVTSLLIKNKEALGLG